MSILDYLDDSLFVEGLLDNYPEDRYGWPTDPWDLSLLIYPKYCKAWIDWYFTPILEAEKRDRMNHIPLTMDHLCFCAQRLPCKEADARWPDAVYAASMVIYNELYRYAMEDKLIASDMTLQDFIKKINFEIMFTTVPQRMMGH